MRKILVVDNDPVILKLMGQVFEGKDYEVIATEGGLEALEKLECENPDLIILDLVMTKMSGKIICEVIRSKRQFSQIPIIVLSAVLAEEKTWEEIGADAFVAKGPFKEMKKNLLDAVEEVTKEGHQKKHPTTRICSPKRILGLEKHSPRQIVKELMEANRRLVKVISHITEGLIEVDQNFKIINTNEAVSRILNRGHLSLVGEDSLKLLGIGDEISGQDLLTKLQSGEQPFLEFQRLLENGKYVNIILNPVMNNDSSPPFIILLTDVTEKKKLYQEKLEKTRLSVMFEMAGTVTHEFRQPITVIQGLAQLAERKLGLLEGHMNVNVVSEYLEKIREECQRLNDLTIRVANMTQYQTKDINKGTIVDLPEIRTAQSN